MMLVMKYRQNNQLPYCGEYLSIDFEQWSVAGLVEEGKNTAELGYLNGGVFEPYKIPWCPSLESCGS